jgi:hypothetical protein
MSIYDNQTIFFAAPGLQGGPKRCHFIPCCTCAVEDFMWTEAPHQLRQWKMIKISYTTVNYKSFLKSVNPKPHGSGPICPHFFQRPISQKGLKQKKFQKLAIPRKMSAE